MEPSLRSRTGGPGGAELSREPAPGRGPRAEPPPSPGADPSRVGPVPGAGAAVPVPVPCCAVPAPGRARLSGAGGGGAERRRRPGGDGVSGSAGAGDRQRAGHQGGAHRVLPVSRERGGGAGGGWRPGTGGCETRGDALRGARVPRHRAGQPPAPGGGLRVPRAPRVPLGATAPAQRPSARPPPSGRGLVPSAGSRGCRHRARLPGGTPARGRGAGRPRSGRCWLRAGRPALPGSVSPAGGGRAGSRSACGPWRDGGCGSGAAPCLGVRGATAAGAEHGPAGARLPAAGRSCPRGPAPASPVPGVREGLRPAPQSPRPAGQLRQGPQLCRLRAGPGGCRAPSLPAPLGSGRRGCGTVGPGISGQGPGLAPGDGLGQGQPLPLQLPESSAPSRAGGGGGALGSLPCAPSPVHWGERSWLSPTAPGCAPAQPVPPPRGCRKDPSRTSCSTRCFPVSHRAKDEDQSLCWQLHRGHRAGPRGCPAPALSVSFLLTSAPRH